MCFLLAGGLKQRHQRLTRKALKDALYSMGHLLSEGSICNTYIRMRSFHILGNLFLCLIICMAIFP